MPDRELACRDRDLAAPTVCSAVARDRERERADAAFAGLTTELDERNTVAPNRNLGAHKRDFARVRGNRFRGYRQRRRQLIGPPVGRFLFFLFSLRLLLFIRPSFFILSLLLCGIFCVGSPNPWFSCGFVRLRFVFRYWRTRREFTL